MLIRSAVGLTTIFHLQALAETLSQFLDHFLLGASFSHFSPNWRAVNDKAGAGDAYKSNANGARVYVLGWRGPSTNLYLLWSVCPLSTGQIVWWWVLHPIIVLSCTQSKHCCMEEISSRISTNQVVASWLSVNTISAKGSELNAVCRCVIEIYQIYIFIPPHKAVTWSTWLDISLFGLLVRLKTHLGTSELLGNSQHKIYEKNRAEQNETSPRTMNGQKLPHTPVHL